MPVVYAQDAVLIGSPAPRDLQLSNRRSTLVGEFLFGLDLLQSRENSAVVGAVPGSELPVGAAAAAVYGDHQVELGAGFGFDTGIVASGMQTILIATTVGLSDAASTAQQHIFVNVTAPDAGRLTMIGNNQSIMGGLSGVGASPTAITPSAPYSAPRVLAARVSGLATGATFALDEFMGGIRTKGAKFTTTSDRTAPTSRITLGNSGLSAPGSGYDTRSRYTAALIHNAYLSDADLLSEYLYLAAVLAEMGKTV